MTCQELINYIAYWNGIASYFAQQENNALTQAADYYAQAEAQGCFGGLAAVELEEIRTKAAPITDLPDDFKEFQQEVEAIAKKFETRHSKPGEGTA